MADPSPTVRQRRLAAELRRLRERRGLTPEQAAAAAGFSRSKLVLIETAKQVPKLPDVEAILGAYGGEDPLKPALIQLARDVRKRGWWTAYGDVLSQSFAELEDAASSIRTWQLEVVHGLLQTTDYARELIGATTQDVAEIERRLEARQHRQTVLSRANAPGFQVLLHEAALRTWIGGPDVFRTQLAELRIAGRRPNISVRVLRTSSGVRPGIGEGSFTIFDFPAPLDTAVVHLDSVAGSIYVEEVGQVTRCNDMYERIAEACLSEEESAEMISALIEE